MHNYEEPKLIAEIGCNHKGDIQIAKQMIDMAATECKTTYVKFQKRCVKESLKPDEFNSPHPNPQNSYGNTYGEHRLKLEFSIDQHRELMEYCSAKSITYFASVWDITSAREIISLSPELLKIPSACSTHEPLLKEICGNFPGEIHISLGMTTRKEEEQIINMLTQNGRAKDTVLYHCISGYPVPFEDMCLLEIERLRRNYSSTVKDFGLSGHHLGIAVDIAAYTLGANWIERHFTLDRTWKGTDHAASLEPTGLKKLKRDLSAVYFSLRTKEKDILSIEEEQRKKLKWNR